MKSKNISWRVGVKNGRHSALPILPLSSADYLEVSKSQTLGALRACPCL